MLRHAAPRNRAGLPSGEVTNSVARRSAGRAVAASSRRFSAHRPCAASRVPLRRRAPELVTSPPGSPAHAQSLPSRLPPRRPAPALIPGRAAAIAPGRPAPVGTPRRGNFLLLYTSGRGAAFRRGQGVVNAPRWPTLLVGVLPEPQLSSAPLASQARWPYDCPVDLRRP